MGWWLVRTFGAVLLVLLGVAVGAFVGSLVHVPLVGMVLGGMLVLATVVLRDSWRGQGLMNWLRGPLTAPAPRDSGFWGELAYRTEKAMRAREMSTQRESERLAQFLSAIEASPNGVMMLDAADQIEWCNSVAAEHFGLDPERDRRQRVTNLVRTPAFVSHLHGGRYDEAIEFPGPLGRSSLSVLVRPYGDGMKLVLSQDITARERTEAMRRDFVANVSHEIRTPLTVLAGFVETLTQLPLTEPERQRVLQLMGQQAERMQSLVGDLLTLARLEGSPRPAPDRWCRIDEVMLQARRDAEGLSAGRHEVVTEGGGDAEVAGSDAELYSAVVNLLNNAVRYTPERGRICLRWVWRDDGGGVIEVQDTGIGIAREHLSRLTERFYRVDGSRSRDTGGTGLGLSIVKHVAQRHGGEIEVQSEPGKGSCFRLVLPALRVRRRREVVTA